MYHAAARVIEIEKLDSNFEGDLDLRGFLNLSKDEPKGYQEIRANFKVKTKVNKEDLMELFKFSPVYEMVSARVPVKINVETY